MVVKKRKAVKKKAVRKPAKKKPARKSAPRKKIIKKSSVKSKKITRKTIKKKVVKKAAPAKKRVLGAKAIGIITHYFPKVQAAVIKLNAPLKLGDKVKMKGHTTDFVQTITSMQIDRTPITSAQKGQEIGLMVVSRVRRNDIVCQP